MGRKIKPGCNEILYWEVSFFLHAWKNFPCRFQPEKKQAKKQRGKENKQNKKDSKSTMLRLEHCV